MYRSRRMVLFFGVVILFNMIAGFAHPVTPTLFKDLGMPDYLFGHALAALLVMNFLFSPFWGKLNGYLSSRIIMLIACCGYAVGQYFFTSSTTEIGFIFARLFAGIFTGGVYVSTVNYPINMAPDGKTRGVWLATSAIIQSVANAFGFFVGGMLGAVSVSYALIIQIIGLALCGVLFLVVCENDARMPLKSLDPRQLIGEANPLRALWDSKQFLSGAWLLLFLMCGLQSLGQIAFDQSFNYYLRDQFGFSSVYNGALKAAMGLVALVANGTICMYLMQKTDKKKSLIWLFALCAATMLVITNMHSVAPFLTINVLFYAFSSICLPLLQDAAADNAEGKNSNLIIGFFNAMKSLGGIVGALAAGLLYVVNPIYPFVCTALAFGIGTVTAGLYFRKSRMEAYARKSFRGEEQGRLP